MLPYLLSIHSRRRDIFMLIVDEGAKEVPDSLKKWASTYEYASEMLVLTSVQPKASEAAEAIAAAAGAKPPEVRAQLTPLSRAFDSEANASFMKSFNLSASSVEATFLERFGEAIVTLVARLEPIVLEIEASTCVLPGWTPRLSSCPCLQPSGGRRQPAC